MGSGVSRVRAIGGDEVKKYLDEITTYFDSGVRICRRNCC